MLVWRLTKAVHAPGLDGEGARLWGGRWNSPGLPAVYCSASPSLAVLESFVHVPPAMRVAGGLPPLSLVNLEVPDHLSAETSPPGLTDGYAQKDFGDEWMKSGRSCFLSARSAVIPQERNVILNPRHPDMAQVKVISIDPFQYDSRLLTP